jgi:AraC-like DNA-binding protein
MNTQAIKSYQKEIGEGQIHMMRVTPRNDQMHRHIFFELVYIVSGTATHHLEQDTTQLRAGDYFIIDTGSIHCYRDVRNFEIINCLFLPEYIDRALTDCPSLSSLLYNQVLRFGLPVNIQTADRIFHDSEGVVGQIIRKMEQEYAAKGTGYLELLRCYLTQVLVCAVRASEEAERIRTPHRATTAIVEHLRCHYTEPLSLDELSRKLNYTPQYISSLFHKDTGMSLQEFLQRIRIEEACRLIEQGEQQMVRIAQKVGYGDVKHFARVFRRIKGVSPREFRSEIKRLL